MKRYKEFVVEALRTHDEINLFKKVISSRDVEVKLVPSQGTESTVKIRSKSVNPDYVFILRVIDITLTDIGSSVNIDF